MIYGVLSVLNEQQAKERSGVSGSHNSGEEQPGTNGARSGPTAVMTVFCLACIL